MGERYPLPFTSFSSFFPFPLPCREAAPWKPARGLGSSVISPSGVRGEAAAYIIWCILSLKIAPGGNIFFTYALRKKQLYRQEVPERRSKIYTNKNFQGMSRRNTASVLKVRSLGLGLEQFGLSLGLLTSGLVNIPGRKQEAQLMLTTGSTRLAVSRGQQTWYHSTCYI